MNWLNLAFGEFQSFFLSTIVRLDATCNCAFSGQPVFYSSVKPFWLHEPIQVYITLPYSRINNSSVSFGWCRQNNLTRFSQLKSFWLCDLVQSFLVPQHLKSKNNNKNNRVCARQIIMTLCDVHRFWLSIGWQIVFFLITLDWMVLG